MRQLKITSGITLRTESLQKYLQEISRIPLLSPDEEVALAERIRKGDMEARDRLVCANLRFVVSVAKQYQNQGLSLADLIDEGNIGLIKAATKFNETLGFKFISYAVWWIRQTILQAIGEKARVVQLPLNQVGLQNKIAKTVATFEQEHERKPSNEEIAALLGMPVEKIETALKASGKQVSVDAPFSDDDTNRLIDVIPNNGTPSTDSALNQESLSKELNQLMQTQLTPRERNIVKMFFGIGCQEQTLEEIGAKFNLTRERVRQIKEKAIRRLKGHNDYRLKAYLA
ncbi:MAG: RNA polymerase sigma factor RpoD/SigA [Bacteroidales bacterium]|nr:RNA polymerase sigma factor RpoD/SigA [Bacteroidales bacterium]MDY3912612.1 RNA polymerase sigma factor RpoD/SigA [Sodaliphilus sp.]